MAPKFTIKYGDGEMELRQSEKLVAVRPRAGRDSKTIRGVRVAADVAGGPTTLGGYQLVQPDSESTSAGSLLDTLRSDDAVAAATEVFYTSDDDVPFVATGQVYVRFRASADADVIHQLLDESGLAILEQRDRNEFILQTTSKSTSPLAGVQTLQRSEAVEVAEPEFATFGSLKSFRLPDDELLRDQWHLKNLGEHYGTSLGFKAGADAGVVSAWQAAETLGSRSVIVAVIDDGFDLGHPDLGGPDKVIASHDFSRNSADPRPDWRSQDWHGTACAGVAVGEANSLGILGAAPGARLMPVRWGPDLSDSQIEKWFDWVTRQGAAVVSCSWGAAAKVFRLSARARRAIERCAREGRDGKGCVVCFAAGNADRDINNPPYSVDGFAIHPDVVAVAACNSRDQRSNYSNYGAEIWVCAPSSGAGGWGILTTDVTGTYVSNGAVYEMGYAPGGYTTDFGGTSSACPLVAGVCALILTVNPSLTAADVRSILRDTARKIGTPADYEDGHSRFFGYGCIDAETAVQEALKRKGACTEAA